MGYMTEFYNAFGKLITSDSIEHFAQEEEERQEEERQEKEMSMLAKIKLFKAKLESGRITQNEIKEKMVRFKKLLKEEKLSDEEKKALEDLIKNTVRKVDGINLIGNLDLGGIIKARGFYLQDGTKVKEIIRNREKLAVPLVKKGNVVINPGKGKNTVVNSNLGVKGKVGVDGPLGVKG